MSPKNLDNLPKVVPTLAEQAMLSKEGTQRIPRIELESAGSAPEEARGSVRVEVPEIVRVPEVGGLSADAPAAEGVPTGALATEGVRDGAREGAREDVREGTREAQRGAQSGAPRENAAPGRREPIPLHVRRGENTASEDASSARPAGVQQRQQQQQQSAAAQAAQTAQAAQAAPAGHAAPAAAPAEAAAVAQSVPDEYGAGTADPVPAGRGSARGERAEARGGARGAGRGFNRAADPDYGYDYDYDNDYGYDGERGRAPRKRPRVLRVIAIIVGVLLVLCVALCAVLAWFEWGKGDDAIDIQGEWVTADSAAAAALVGNPTASPMPAATAAPTASSEPTAGGEGASGANPGQEAETNADADADADADEGEGEGEDAGLDEFAETETDADSDESADAGAESDSDSKAGESGTIVITAENIRLTKDAAYSYEIDTLTKTITFTFADKAGSGRYRFSADRTQLAIIEGSPAEGKALASVKEDFGWRIRSFCTWLTTGDPLPPSDVSAQEQDSSSKQGASHRTSDAVLLVKVPGTSADTVSQRADATPPPVITIER